MDALKSNEDCVPIILDCGELRQKRILIRKNQQVASMISKMKILLKNLKVTDENSCVKFTVDNKPMTSFGKILVKELYDRFKSEDCFLYVSSEKY